MHFLPKSLVHNNRKPVDQLQYRLNSEATLKWNFSSADHKDDAELDLFESESSSDSDEEP